MLLTRSLFEPEVSSLLQHDKVGSKRYNWIASFDDLVGPSSLRDAARPWAKTCPVIAHVHATTSFLNASVG